MAGLESILESADNSHIFLSNVATHIEIRYKNCSITAQIFNRYLELEPLGPIIGGDMVIQGLTLPVVAYGPALCVVEYAADHEEEFKVIHTIAPWQMMCTPPVGAEEGYTFAIPFSLNEECREGTIRVRIGAAPLDKIPFDDAQEDYNMQLENYVTAIEFTKSTREAEVGEPGEPGILSEDIPEEMKEGRNPLETFNVEETATMAEQQAYVAAAEESIAAKDIVVVKNLHVIMDLDEFEALHSQGHELHTMRFTTSGVNEDYPTNWKFYVTTEMGLASDGGVEDIKWLHTEKSMGNLPSLDGYKVILEDLSNIDDDSSVYLAVKIGSKPRYSKLTNICGNVDVEETIIEYINNNTSLDFRRAPQEICDCFGGCFGLSLFQLPSANEYGIGEDLMEQSEMAGVEGGSVPSTTSMSPESVLDDDYSVSEDATLSGYYSRIAELEAERDRLKEYHVEIQRKAAAMMARDKSIAGVGPGKGDSNAGADVNASETEMEKEKHYNDVLQLVSECRKKLYRQQQEFDQLAHDLQTRLDDKEYKASEIAASFQEFKREIMAKAQNSRTGKAMSKRLIEQYEAAEQRKEADLEKVRLRNIALRTSLKKLERQLRAREQLAEGLHMIDFEQLKIENQTLNEKIEERNEELAKLKRKKTATVQVLTHIREKLKFVENQNGMVKNNLGDIEQKIMAQRSVLTSAKHDRDFVRDDNSELKRKQVLVISFLFFNMNCSTFCIINFNRGLLPMICCWLIMKSAK